MEWLLGIAITVAIAFSASIFGFAHHRPSACQKFCAEVRDGFAAMCIFAMGALVGWFITTIGVTQRGGFADLSRETMSYAIAAANTGMGMGLYFATACGFFVVLWLAVLASAYVATLSIAQGAKVDGPKPPGDSGGS